MNLQKKCSYQGCHNFNSTWKINPNEHSVWLLKWKARSAILPFFSSLPTLTYMCASVCEEKQEHLRRVLETNPGGFAGEKTQTVSPSAIFWLFFLFLWSSVCSQLTGEMLLHFLNQLFQFNHMALVPLKYGGYIRLDTMYNYVPCSKQLPFTFISHFSVCIVKWAVTTTF